MPRKVVLVHDWLTGMRGGEKVLEILVAGISRDGLCRCDVHDRRQNRVHQIREAIGSRARPGGRHRRKHPNQNRSGGEGRSKREHGSLYSPRGGAANKPGRYSKHKRHCVQPVNAADKNSELQAILPHLEPSMEEWFHQKPVEAQKWA